MMKKLGLVQVYAGSGKGKTTAACGLAVRAVSHGFRVGWVSFYKDPRHCKRSEHQALKKLGVKVRFLVKQHPMCVVSKSSAAFKELREVCLKGLNAVRKIYQHNNLDMLIIDEINISVRDGFLKESEVLKIIADKPENLELVLTGRGATKKMIAKADLVSIVNEIKHPYSKGVQARKGIEY